MLEIVKLVVPRLELECVEQVYVSRKLTLDYGNCSKHGHRPGRDHLPPGFGAGCTQTGGVYTHVLGDSL